MKRDFEGIDLQIPGFQTYDVDVEASLKAEVLEMMEVDESPPDGAFGPLYVCIISLDSLKYGEYKYSNELHVVRVTHRDIHIDSVTFHQWSLEIAFYCLSDADPLLQKYDKEKSTLFVWHAELANDIIPRECEMRAGDREFLLKKRDPSQWTSGLLQCSSASAVSARSSSATRLRNTTRSSTTYRYHTATADPGLPPRAHPSGSSANRASSYVRTATHPTTVQLAYSPHTYTSSTVFSNYLPTSSRSRSNSTVLRRSSSSTALAPSSNVLLSSPSQGSSSSCIYTSARAPVPSASLIRPTAKVLPYDEQGTVVDFGFTGLRNIGNTCFMNATLQMLVNCKELQIYFSGGHYKNDINTANPLGFGGRLAAVFAEFMKEMWSGLNRVYEPTKIKELVAEKASQFANFAQHDAQEFLGFVIDGLHEDLNRVRSKPLTSTVEADGRQDMEVSREAWHNHLLRNDSVFVDLFHGQLKSRLQCPKCFKISITFDPFVYLSVPFPKEKRSSTVYFWPLDPVLKPIKITVRYNADGKMSEMLSAIGHMVNVSAKALKIIEVSNHRIARFFSPDDNASHILSNDVIYAFQLHDPDDCNEEVVELAVVQRLLYRRSIVRACANCFNTEDKLRSCDRCYDVFYCRRECQVDHWSKEHKNDCKSRTQIDAVGQPFIISLPKSKLTYQTIVRNLESRCRHSVNVFQPPVDTNDNNNNGDNLEVARDSVFESMPSTSSSHVEKNGDAVSPLEKNPAPAPSRRQMVLGEPRQKTRNDCRLFLVRKLQQQETVVGETLVDENGRLNIPTGSWLSINWYNIKMAKDYLTVESKCEVDIDSERTAHFQKMSLSSASSSNISSNPSLYDMLAMFSELERLKPEESWYCNKCKEHVEATKQLALYRLPPILIVQLKRFVYTTSIMSMHRRSKDDRPVRYPIDGLDLSNFLSSTAPSSQETMYDLVGVVCHSGSSYFGHYISFGRLQSIDGKQTEIDWRNFDDSVVSRASLSRVLNDDAYLLFYKQRGTITRDLLKHRYGIA